MEDQLGEAAADPLTRLADILNAGRKVAAGSAAVPRWKRCSCAIRIEPGGTCHSNIAEASETRQAPGTRPCTRRAVCVTLLGGVAKLALACGVHVYPPPSCS